MITEKEMERILQEEPDEKVVFEAVRKYRAQHAHEDKDLICQLLCAALKATREHKDLQELYYQKLDSGDETVTVRWSCGGTTVVNVTADSGIAMIRDILQAIK